MKCMAALLGEKKKEHFLFLFFFFRKRSVFTALLKSVYQSSHGSFTARNVMWIQVNPNPLPQKFIHLAVNVLSVLQPSKLKELHFFSDPFEEEQMDYTDNNTESFYIMYTYTNIDDIPDQLCRKDAVAKVGSIVVPLFFSIVVLLSLIGNILVLVTLAYYENLKSLTNIFILNLAVSDLIFTVGLPFWACYYIWGWTLGDAACKTVCFVFYAGFYSSVMFLMMMTFQRYLAVVYPHSDWEKRQGISLIPILGWVVSIGAALPAPIYSSVIANPKDDSQLYCEYNSREAYLALTYEQNLFFVFAFLFMGFCYISILLTIVNKGTKKRRCTIKLIFCIIVMFFLGWAPYNLVIFLQTLTYLNVKYFTDCEVTHHLDYAGYVCKFLAFSHCCFNPVLYVFVAVKFRNDLKEILQKIF
ncbi:chemokine XC receptor 1-like [Hemibagrus wyckioides]|uniref:chemokine XC receptor 1-like n=1 Tax=Hemibagrus wyckioides TaxID=337641 RepID=UPI00266D5B36|nr:chemokine XC receptor 1-like [Hemibagrus wyckioides]